MRCEGAESPPCRRCRHTGLDCLFEKPSREATLTGEAGLESVYTCSTLLWCLSISFSSPDASGVWRIMLPKSAERNWLSQRKSQSCCITYVLEGPMRIDLLQHLHFPHSRSRQIVQSLQLYLHRMLLLSMRRLRVPRHRSLRCTACPCQNIEVLFRSPGIKVRPINQLGRMTISHPCTAIIKAAQAITYTPHQLKVLFYLHSLASSLWLLP